VEFIPPGERHNQAGKKKKMLTPATFSLIHATDFADRTEHSILPLLKAAQWCSVTGTYTPHLRGM